MIRDMFSKIACILGLHDWVLILPGTEKVSYQGKLWQTIGPLSRAGKCSRCGKLMEGQTLIPMGWEGEFLTVGAVEANNDRS